MADDNKDDAPPAPEPSLRDDIASAFDTIETRDAPPDPALLPTPAPASDAPPAPAAAPSERARGPERDPATGRFKDAPGKAADAPAAAPKAPGAPPAPKQALNGDKPPQAAPKAPADPAAPPAPALKPPASWKPGAREHWAKLPPDVQQEVVRREAEVMKGMQESAAARNALGHVQQVLGPFAQNVAAAGTDALTMMSSLFKADNTLRHGSHAEKAAMVADIIKSYGVDIATLDAVLSGQVAPSDPTSQMAERLRKEMQAQLQPVLGFVQSMQGRRQQQLAQISSDAGNDVEAFAADASHEFFDDVRADMADIIDMYTARGQAISLQDAYDRAIKINPQVSEIISKRAETERASAAAQAAQRAKRAAASITSAPAPAGAGPGPAGDDRRAQIAAAFDQASDS